MTRPQAEINTEIERLRPKQEATVRRIERTFAVCEEIAKQQMEMDINMEDEAKANVDSLHHAAHPPAPQAVDISSEEVAEWITGFRTWEWPEGWTPQSWNRERLADMLEALVADRDRLAKDRDDAILLKDSALDSGAELLTKVRIAVRRMDAEHNFIHPGEIVYLAEKLVLDRDRLRAFVRSARGIIHEYASEYRKHVWGGHKIDPMGAHEWLSAEATEIGTACDGGDPKVERT